jgi:aspartate aminotransferase-like enzyme
MHIEKQRLLTAGPAPLYPKALHAMMDADIHHRTGDFPKPYRVAVQRIYAECAIAKKETVNA